MATRAAAAVEGANNLTSAKPRANLNGTASASQRMQPERAAPILAEEIKAASEATADIAPEKPKEVPAPQQSHAANQPKQDNASVAKVPTPEQALPSAPLPQAESAAPNPPAQPERGPPGPPPAEHGSSPPPEEPKGVPATREEQKTSMQANVMAPREQRLEAQSPLPTATVTSHIIHPVFLPVFDQPLSAASPLSSSTLASMAPTDATRAQDSSAETSASHTTNRNVLTLAPIFESTACQIGRTLLPFIAIVLHLA